ncbi:MAG: M67 family metallopeptidase [Solirubrobacterales bacterium]|nr:M67 family metallopeptidase [Solirubrobacterales bacterium]
MLIAPDLLQQLIAHALQEAPNECCGVIASEPGAAPGGPAPGGPEPGAAPGGPSRAVRVHRARNTAASPLRFEIDGLEVLKLIEAIERDGLELGAIYHSHTRTAPRPSQTDINFAAHWPGVEWVIVGLADPGSPGVRSYLIDGGAVSEVELRPGSAVPPRG